MMVSMFATFILLLFVNTGDSTSIFKEARCLVPKDINSVSRALLLQQCISANQAEGNETICYIELGCFPMENPWVNNMRPFPSPMTPHFIDTRLYLYTRSSPSRYNVALWPNVSLEGSSFSNNKSTVFITHGFANNGNISWMAEMKDNYLKKVDANVFLVDWGKGAMLMNYLQVASNTRIVGAELARFIQYLTDSLQLDPNNIHLIGHSLGAHISGYAAKKVEGIGKITALDPAQPGFEAQPREVRLDRDDANFVEVIHTNCRPFVPLFGFGMITPVGHVDIYVNGGLDQPGCFQVKLPNVTSIQDLAEITVEAISDLVGCSHGRAYSYYSESLISNCTIWARQAGLVENTLKALTLGNAATITEGISKCGVGTCTVLGLNSFLYKARGCFAAVTKMKSPFCDYDPEYDARVKHEIVEDAKKKLSFFDDVRKGIRLLI